MKYNGESGYNIINDNKPRIPILGRIHFNSPVILGFTFISLIVLIASELTGGLVGSNLAITFTRWLDPLMYVRMVTHIFAHGSVSHYTSNFLLILTIGPMVEEKYGSKALGATIFLTAILTGIINVILFPHVRLLGASGIAFMLIILGSFTNIKKGRIPLTVLLVSAIYIGNEIVSGLISVDNISHFGHIIGGLCGAGFGLLFHGAKMKGLED